METTRGVSPRHVFLVDRAIHLLHHLEILMDGVAGEGIERHGRPRHLEWPRRQGFDIGDARVGTEREAQPGATGAEQKLILGWQPRVPARETQDPDIRRDRANTAHVGWRQYAVGRLVLQVRATEELSTIGRGSDLVLTRPCKVRSRCAGGSDDVLGQQVAYALLD